MKNIGASVDTVSTQVNEIRKKTFEKVFEKIKSVKDKIIRK